MIVHRYIPFDGSEDPFSPEDLLAKVGELIMKYQLDLDEALKVMIARGQVPNLFLKQVGLTDFLAEIITDLKSKITDITGKWDPVKNREDFQNRIDYLLDQLRKSLGDNAFDTMFKAQDSELLDNLFHLRWSLIMDSTASKNILSQLDEVLDNYDTRNLIDRALKSFEFSGEDKIPENEIESILKKLFDLEYTVKALEDAMSKGDFQSLDIKKLGAILGPERIQEFFELQQSLLKHLRDLLEKTGYAEEDQSEGGYWISSRAIEYLSSRALNEFYSNLQSDPDGMNLLESEGESEQTTSKLKNFEFSDNFSNIDWPASLVNALIKQRRIPSVQDLEVYQSRGSAKNAMVVLLDMSGSMFRFDRFYHAKKMILALDKLIKKEYPNDRLDVVGFGSLAKKYNLHELFNLQPFPVLFSEPMIRLELDLSARENNSTDGIPLYFTNLQRGLSLARRLLASKETKNRQIILITDGVPTAHMDGSVLHLNYPPVESDFDAAIKEARICREEKIIINTFLLSSEWWENFSVEPEEKSFANRFVKTTGGRFFQTHPYELGVTVLYDFIKGQKKNIRWENGERGEMPETDISDSNSF